MSIGTTNAENMKNLVNLFYPVGSIYMNAKSETLPTVLSTYGTWERLPAGHTVISAKVSGTASSGFVNDYTIGKTGGEETHTLTLEEMPKHRHTEETLLHTPKKVTGAGSTWAGYVSETGWTETPKGQDKAHNNTPLYCAVAMWKRTA